MSTRDRYRTTPLRSGVVIQGGLDPRRRGDPPPRAPMFGLYRASVIATYVSSDSNNLSESSVECDVVLVSSQIPLTRVPVAQQNHGVNNASLWVPRPSTRVIDSETPLNLTVLTRRGNVQGEATSLADLDGDMVIVQFAEGDVEFPIITHALTHERTKRLIVSGDGWAEGDDSSRGAPHSNEYYVNHYGTEVRINSSGDLLIDTVGAHADLVEEDPSTGAGQVRVRLKETQRFTVEMDGTDVLEVYKDSTGVHIDLGEGASEKIILGNKFKDEIYNVHSHNTGFGPTDKPNQQMTDSHLSAQHRVK